VTTPEDTTEQASAAGYHASRGDAPAGTSPSGGLADGAMRVPWLWPTLLTLLLGIYQLGRPELRRDELWSWSFASSRSARPRFCAGVTDQSRSSSSGMSRA
jgi:hypothetical protein